MSKTLQAIGLIVVLIVVVSIVFVGCKKQETSEIVEDSTEVVEEIDETAVAEKEVPVEETAPEEKETVNSPITVTDGLGNEVMLESPAESLIVFAPSVLEVIDAIGGMGKVVGVDNWSIDNEEPLAEGLEGFGDYEGLNMEKIAEADPDVIVRLEGQADEDFAKVKDFGIKVYTFKAQSFEGAYREITNIGLILGLEEEARELEEEFRTEVQEINSKVSGLKEEEKPKVFYEIYDEPLWSAGKGTFIDDMISKAGGINIVSADGLEGYVEYSVERLLENNPGIMIAGDGGMYESKTADVILDDPRFSNVKAVLEDNVFIIPENSVVRPNHNTVKGLLMFAKAMHPDIFGEFEIVE
ncbi:MAG: ABC transporter substrate-binding protein [Actinomycetota bacterium]